MMLRCNEGEGAVEGANAAGLTFGSNVRRWATRPRKENAPLCTRSDGWQSAMGRCLDSSSAICSGVMPAANIDAARLPLDVPTQRSTWMLKSCNAARTPACLANAQKPELRTRSVGTPADDEASPGAAAARNVDGSGRSGR
jgi:hypothetical protein